MRIMIDQAEKWLNDLGIRVLRMDGTQLGVSRADMVNVLGSDETELLFALRDAFNTKRFMWVGRDDEWLYLGAI